MPTGRCMQRLSSETHFLSRDPNLADRSYFDPITRENNDPLPEDRNAKARLWTSKNMGPENPDAEWRQKRRAAICERRSPKGLLHRGLSTLPLAVVSGGSRQSSGMDLNASIVIFAIPSIFRGH
jgi:hypothetical protein